MGKIDRNAMWQVLEVYKVCGETTEAVNGFKGKVRQVFGWKEKKNISQHILV